MCGVEMVVRGYFSSIFDDLKKDVNS
jgi:hypothetical protein